MTTRLWQALSVVVLAGLVACGGGGGGDNPPEECATHDECPARQYCSAAGDCLDLAAGACRKEADCSATENCVAEVCQPVAVAECDKAANVAKRAELLAAQPTLAVRASSGKTVKAFTTTFASVADDPGVQCEVTGLQFKDLNDDDALQPYEDWTKTAAARAVDLVSRMTANEKMALMAHATLADAPTGAGTPSAATLAAIAAGIRYGRTSALTSDLTPRANWANLVQEECEGSALGVPFVLSAEPQHFSGNGRVLAKSFHQFPHELSLAASGDATLVGNVAHAIAVELRAVGVRMTFGPSGDLVTDPRWYGGQFTFGEDSTAVSNLVEAFVEGAQGDTLGPTSVACVATGFPGSGATTGGWDAKLAKGKFSVFSGTHVNEHLAPFARAGAAGVAAVMPGYGIPQTGAWTGVGGLDGPTIEQVGASFNAALLTGVLRGSQAYGGLVIAPWGVLEDAGLAPFGAPWGMETAARAERVAKAVNAGVDQFGGLNDVTPIAAASTAGTITGAQIDAAAGRALELTFRLGLFENPYVNAAGAPAAVAQSGGFDLSVQSMQRGWVLLVNEDKPQGPGVKWLNGREDISGCDMFDGTQVSDSGNAGNGSMKVLPAPPGTPYEVVGCNFFVSGAFDLDYVRSVAAGYGQLTNDVTGIKGDQDCVTDDLQPVQAVATRAQRMAYSDYVFVMIRAPFTSDPDSGAFDYSLSPLEWAANANAAELDAVEEARLAIDSVAGSRAQLVVLIVGGRPSVVSEVMAYAPSAVYYAWGARWNEQPDKAALDAAFGIGDGTAKLPVGLPASDAAAAAQLPDVAGDGQHGTFVRGFGIETVGFF